VVTEAGFGSDLGAEKFCDIKCRVADLHPCAAVVVATVRALKMHGGVPLGLLRNDDAAAVARGVENLEKHCDNMRIFGLEPIVAINRFPTDSQAEIDAISDWCARSAVKFAVSDVWARGGDGGIDLAKLVVEAAQSASAFHPIYPLHMPIHDKAEIVARTIYGADGVDFLPAANRQIREIERMGFRDLPICVAKTQNSLSDDTNLTNRPRGFRVTIREAKLSAGSGMVVLYAGAIMTMPGLAKIPSANKINFGPDGDIVGLF